ncbi:Methyltransferase [Colletotrichum higginsianum IMI 349063]|uniref:Methyltransferase n=1 Tax=Colletotrichum higginsianum (strain IMI 349063) TaxID=759273 RepID=A0A1B7YJU5_COLHI|nr:Methyltransferase [Colletotrichum higginsianum IMI 349063]OBR12351.1 Methyltransferase [Colletotrichum higginsianum IMI 349063]
MAVFESRMSFLQPWAPEKGNPFVRGAPAEGFETLNYSNQEHAVKITDARPNMGEYDINTHGFAYHHDASITADLLEALRANDKAAVAAQYYPLVEKLVKEKTGANRVVIFDHTLRRRDPALATTDNPNGREQPASLLHLAYWIDTDPPSALSAACTVAWATRPTIFSRAVLRLSSSETASIQVSRDLDQANTPVPRRPHGLTFFRSVWRPLRGPVEEWPLATMDGRTLKDGHVHPTNIFKHQYSLQGQTVSISYAPEQRWFYLDHQDTDEVTFIKIWDNKDDVKSKLCAHCAFPHPETPENAALRESMKVRCLVFYEE